MKNKTIAMFVALGVIGMLGVGFVAAFPGYNQDLSEEEIAEMKEFKENVRTAIENEDFETWKTLMESKLTEENFNKMVERHSEFSEVIDLKIEIREALESGDEAKAEELREELRDLGFERKGFQKGFRSNF